MIKRPYYLKKIKKSLSHYPVTAILGPRQCGKTTFAKIILKETGGIFFDLENPSDLARLTSPMLAFENEEGLIVIDEIQRKPELFSVLRVLADQPKGERRFLILGSASPFLLKKTSDSLAGRISFIDLSGFTITEVGIENYKKLWIRGGLPPAFLAEEKGMNNDWLNNYIRTFLERDIPQLGITIPAETLRRFWTMVAHYHGQLWNAAEFARSLGTSEPTSRKYLDILTGAYVIRQIQPWFENIKKRQVKAPKLYIRDTGLLHALLNLPDEISLLGNPKVGASWEGFVIEQIIFLAQTPDIYFWSVYSGGEVDCLVFKNGKKYGFEIKFMDSPGVTKSIKSAILTLHLDHVFIIQAGKEKYRLDKNITVIPISALPDTFRLLTQEKKNILTKHRLHGYEK